MPTTQHTGFAGEAAVASEFSLRGYVVSMPTIDLGNDLFVENHSTGQAWRIQVKTAMPKQNQPTHYQFSVRETAIHNPSSTASHFVFVRRMTSINRWGFYVIAQPVLSNYVNQGMGSLSGSSRTFTFIRNIATKSLSCSGKVMDGHLNAWSPWPVI